MNSFKLTQNQADFAKLSDDVLNSSQYKALRNTTDSALVESNITKLREDIRTGNTGGIKLLKADLTDHARRYSNTPYNKTQRKQAANQELDDLLTAGGWHDKGSGKGISAEELKQHLDEPVDAPYGASPIPKRNMSEANKLLGQRNQGRNYLIGGAAIGLGAIGLGTYLSSKQKKEKQEATYSYMGKANADFAKLGEDIAANPHYSPRTKLDAKQNTREYILQLREAKKNNELFTPISLKAAIRANARMYSNSPYNVKQREGTTRQLEDVQQQINTAAETVDAKIKAKYSAPVTSSTNRSTNKYLIGGALLAGGIAAGGAYAYNKYNQEEE